MQRDLPSGTGDWETVKDLAETSSGDGLCARPARFEARNVADGTPAGQTGQVLRANDRERGLMLICVNDDQPAGSACHNYEIRMCC